jgi:hypothetical protein
MTMKEVMVVKPSREIWGVEPKVGDEWDAGNVPFGCAFRRVRVTVRREETGWKVFCVAYKGAEKLQAEGDYGFERCIAVLPCETCAKALALCLVFGSGYAVCPDHDRYGIPETLLFDGVFGILLSAMNIGGRGWDRLDEGSQHRLLWAARQIVDGQLDWQKAISAWERAEAQGLPLNAAIRDWDAEMRYS